LALSGKVVLEIKHMLLHVDTKRRITLPPDAGINPGDTIKLEILEDCRIMLIPVKTIPKHQMWAWTPESKQAIEASMSDPRSSEAVESPALAEQMVKRWADDCSV